MDMDMDMDTQAEVREAYRLLLDAVHLLMTDVPEDINAQEYNAWRFRWLREAEALYATKNTHASLSSDREENYEPTTHTTSSTTQTASRHNHVHIPTT